LTVSTVLEKLRDAVILSAAQELNLRNLRCFAV
jgi:hypothetical protein